MVPDLFASSSVVVKIWMADVSVGGLLKVEAYNRNFERFKLCFDLADDYT
jgi:hypothetical protein